MNLALIPIIGITMGDAAGIGPEIIAKALSLREIYEVCKPVVIGDSRAMNEGIKTARIQLKLNPIRDLSGAQFRCGTIDIIDLENIRIDELEMGRPQAMAGKASVDYIKKAVELALKGEINAIATAPISKEAVSMAKYSYIAHTEILADLTHTSNYAMMLVAGQLRVIHVTTHVSLKEALRLIKKDRVLRVLKLTCETMKKYFQIQNPRIAVAGVNPHAGEGGLLGAEEKNEIAPAIEAAKSQGIDARGPIPADTVFVRARGGEFDAVVAMYHDQGHIPVKLLGFRLDEKTKKWEVMTGVNVTIGLSIIRTSVDHGTAYGKAGRKEGTANPQSLVEAIKLAARIATSYSH